MLRKLAKNTVNMNRKLLLAGLCVAIVSASIFTMTARQKEAEAFGFCIPCISCFIIDTFITGLITEIIQEFIFNDLIEGVIEDRIEDHEEWIVEEFFEDYWVRGLAELTEFLGAYGMYQMEMVGAFFDARQQIKTTRLYFELQAEAHRDYHPSESFCYFGTSARSLASSENQARLNALALSQRSLGRQLGTAGTASAISIAEDQEARWNKFVTAHCDIRDNGWTQAGTGLDFACDHDGQGGSPRAGAYDRRRVNLDVDYTRLIDQARTLNVDFTDLDVEANEEDIIAMSNNLYGNTLMTRTFNLSGMAGNPKIQNWWLSIRSTIAKRNVAEHTFNAIVSMKTASEDPATAQTGTFMASLIQELAPTGTPADEIYEIMGTNPSYYAQLEYLSKKIYQNPDFYADLYDKPANIKRKSAAMKAIELMVDRALFESELRQEMVLSVLLSSRLSNDRRNISKLLEVEPIQ